MHLFLPPPPTPPQVHNVESHNLLIRNQQPSVGYLHNVALRYIKDVFFLGSFQNYIAILTHETQYIGCIRIRIPHYGLIKTILKLSVADPDPVPF